MSIVERLTKTPVLLASMALLQALWLAAIWLTGAAAQGEQAKLLALVAYTLVAGLAVAVFPAAWASKVEQLKDSLLQNERRLVLILAVSVLAVAALFAAYQRVLTDEARLVSASKMVAEQGLGPFLASYAKIQWLGRQHPPLAPLAFGLAMSLLGTNLFVIRLVALLLTVATVLLTYFLAAELYDRETGWLAALFLLSFPYFLRMGSAVLTDVPVTFFFTLGLYLARRLLRRPTFPLVVAASVAVGAGLLTKYTAVLVYPVILGWVVVDNSARRLKAHLAVLALVSFGVLALWLAVAYSSGILAAQGKTLANYAGVATSSPNGMKWALEFLLTRLPSALGVYNLPLILLGGLCLLVTRGKADWLILVWIGVVFVVVTLTLPDARYFMPAFPALGIALARAGVKRFYAAPGRVVSLALLYCGGALYLFVDWFRAGYIFLQR
jgi:4-amino-4-deoxy-L-arabinose transferase-like glycosyltransferase